MNIHHTGIEFRDVEQAVEQLVQRFGRAIDFFEQSLAVVIDVAAQRTEIEPHGLHRLAQVVTGGCDKAILRAPLVVAAVQLLERSGELSACGLGALEQAC